MATSVNHELVVRAIVRAAIEANQGNPKAALVQIISGHYSTSVSDGKTLVHAEEAGGAVQFMVPQGYGPLEIMALVEEAIQFIEAQPDQSNICLKTRRIKFFRFSFGRKNFGRGGGGVLGGYGGYTE